MSGGRAVRVRLCAALAGALLAACGARGKPAVREFDGARAFTYLEQQVRFGPRIPGSAAHDSTGDWILARLRERADTVIVQDISHRTAAGQTIHMRNFLARFRPSQAERVLYLAHWDTRPRADQSPNLAAQRQPVLGANDGASGVAVLLGAADAFKAKPPAVGVDLLFVDGEDYGDFADSTAVLIGSRWFAAHQPEGYPPLFAVLFDMVGDRDLHLPFEQNSQGFAPEVVDRVWSVADSLGYGSVFVREPGPSLIDDHVALQRANIHAIDVVDFSYGPNNGYWHTTEDTLDKVSAQSLQIVGDVAVAVVRAVGQ
ncbi:MAG TPA: M28 family peptidase [Gemmatimonadales bacterium]|nr:M28 family peptidase [Gemmatimonadales bacterium]